MGEARNRAQNKLAAARKGCHALSIKQKERERDKGREKRACEERNLCNGTNKHINRNGVRGQLSYARIGSWLTT